MRENDVFPFPVVKCGELSLPDVLPIKSPTIAKIDLIRH
jgi:hypothetical protein